MSHVSVRFLVFLMAQSLVLVTSASAEVKQIIEGTDKPWTYEFVVDVAKPTLPAFKYRVLPDRISRHPGNAAPSYYRALNLFNAHSEEDIKAIEECFQGFHLMNRPPSVKADDTPIAPVSTEFARAAVSKFADVFSELQEAVSCEQCDWGFNLRNKDAIATIGLPVNDFAAMRKLARLIQQKARLAISEGDFDKACPLIQMAFQLGRDIAECPLILPGLVGAAICIEAQVLVMEAIAQPNSPSFYWALSAIPQPLIDIRPSLEEELNLPLKFRILRDAEKTHSPEEWRQIFSEALQYLNRIRVGSKKPDGTKFVPEVVEDLVLREKGRAREELVTLGYPPEQVTAMSDIQAIAVHDAVLLRHKRDAVLKVTNLPFPQTATYFNWGDRRHVIRIDDDKSALLNESIGLFQSLQPEVIQAMAASIRLDRLLVRNQVIEALRLHAAANDGKLPQTLSEVTAVPIPLDPITGKVVNYRLDGETAVLEFPSPVKPIPSYGEITRVTLRKSKP